MQTEPPKGFSMEESVPKHIDLPTFIPDPTQSTTASGQSTEDVVANTSYGLVGVIIFAIVIVMIIIIGRRRIKDDHEDLEEESASDTDDDDTEKVQMRLFGTRESRYDVTTFIADEELLDSINSVTISVSRLTLSRQLGKGQFGAVYEARLAKEGTEGNAYAKSSDERVAVKTLKGAGMSEDEVEAFLREGVIMADFKHKHVLGLVGVAFGDHGVPMIILPFMANGSLRAYISRQDLHLSVRQLLQFGHEVAQGMEYLANQKFVHRDLATRNCMLNEERVVKVADFGLSRDIYTREYYASQDREAKLPVKWMAVESLTTGVYTTRSDVWAFGVLLWELMTRGMTPYPDVANWDIRGYVSSGRRMASPQMCPDDVYEMMLRCWLEQPKDRPSFTELAEELDGIIHEDNPRGSGRDFYINVEPLTP